MGIVARWERQERNKVSQSWVLRNRFWTGERHAQTESSRTRRDALHHTEKGPLTFWAPQEDLSSVLPGKIQKGVLECERCITWHLCGLQMPRAPRSPSSSSPNERNLRSCCGLASLEVGEEREGGDSGMYFWVSSSKRGCLTSL